jgi:P-type Ca2+ transporter type 2C
VDADIQSVEVSTIHPSSRRPRTNSRSNRRLDNKFNIFEGMLQNWFFLGVNFIMIGGQIMIIFIGGKAFSIIGLTGEQWGYSIFFGVLSIPIGAIIRLIPDELIRRLIPEAFLKSKAKGPQVTVEDEEQQFYFPKPLSDVREELSFLKRVKGGRLNNLKFAMQHPRETFMPRSRSGSRSRSNSIPHTPTDGNPEGGFGANLTPESRKRGRSNRSRSNSALGATAVMAGIIAGSVAGWSPIERGHGDNDSIRFSRSRGRSDLGSRDGVEAHPGTKPDDPIITEEPQSYAESPNQHDKISPAPPLGGSLYPPS